MTNLPAVCMTCGRIGRSGIVVDEGATNNLFVGNKTSCVYCGGEAIILDAATNSEGKIEFLKSARDILATLSMSELKKLKGILEGVQGGEPDLPALDAKISNALGEGAAQIGAVLDRSGSAADWINVLIALVALIIMLRESGLSEEQTHQTIYQVINYYESGAVSTEIEPIRPTGQQPKYQGSVRSQSRNSLCYCGSGLKFKRCHGATR